MCAHLRCSDRAVTNKGRKTSTEYGDNSFKVKRYVIYFLNKIAVVTGLAPVKYQNVKNKDKVGNQVIHNQ